MSVTTDQNSSAVIKSFTDLYTWKEGHKFVLMIYEIIKQLPVKERFGLADQLRRAAISITSNIAEGFSRKTMKDKRSFYRISLSSLTEIQNQLLVVRDVQYISKEEFTKLARQAVVVCKLLNGLIKSATTAHT